MPVARIVTRSVTHESPALNELSRQLRAAGYEVVIAEPGMAGTADLALELDEAPLREALDIALRKSRESDADLYIAPGLFAPPAASRDIARDDAAQPSAAAAPSHSDVTEDAAELHGDVERGGIAGSTLEELGAALAEGRSGIRDTVLGMRARAAHAWGQFQQRRAGAVRERRLERERREIEREERRREHERELQRRAEEKQQLLTQRERLAAEQERVVREQLARDAALRAERERAEREAMAREAARRAELACAEEQQQRRLAAMESERLREQDQQRRAAQEAERVRASRDQQAQPAACSDSSPEPAHVEAAPVASAEPVPVTPAPALKPRLVHRPRRRPSNRERRWQRAAFVASVATLAAMLGFAIAANMKPGSPLPASLMQNGAQQQVPFGPAKMSVPAKVNPAVPGSRPGVAQQSSQRRQAGTAKPSAAKPVPRQRARRAGNDRDFVAEDEVIVRHAPASHAQRAQTQRGPATAGVRRYSDDN